MAMNANQDQNFNVHSDGVKTRSSTIQKNKGGDLEGKKAPNDISNSGKKALVDLTDSVKPITPVQSPLKKKSRKDKSIPPIEETFHDHDECIKAQQKARDLDEEDFWRSSEDLSRYPKLKEYFEKKAITEDKVDHGSRNPSGIPVILTNFDRIFCFHATRSPRR